MKIATPLALLFLLTFGCSRPAAEGYRSLKIHAIRATGDSWYKPPQPVWKFIITNAGSLPAYWESGVEEMGGTDTNYSHAGGHIDWPSGTLIPGRAIETNMIVPGSGKSWRAWVDYGSDVRDTHNRYYDNWH